MNIRSREKKQKAERKQDRARHCADPVLDKRTTVGRRTNGSPFMRPRKEMTATSKTCGHNDSSPAKTFGHSEQTNHHKHHLQNMTGKKYPFLDVKNPRG